MRIGLLNLAGLSGECKLRLGQECCILWFVFELVSVVGKECIVNGLGIERVSQVM